MDRLPTFNGYTIDVDFREFRRVTPQKGPEVVPFASPRGQRIIRVLTILALRVNFFSIERIKGRN